MKQNFLVFGKYFPPDHGGIETITEIIFNNLKKINQELICFSKKKRANLLKKNNKIFFFKESFKILSQPFSFTYIVFSFLKIFRNNEIFVHYPNPLVFILLSLFRKKKIIIFWHSDILNKGNTYKWYRFIENLILKRASKIIVTSKSYSSFSKPLKNFKYKIHVVNLTINENIKYKNPFIRKEILSKRYILSIGRLVEYKGYEYLIKSFKFLPQNLKLIIVGNGKLNKKLNNLVKNLKLMNKVSILNNLNSNEKNWLIKKCYAFCLPSINRSEAFGVVLLEAMFHGKPLITSKIKGSGIQEVNIDKMTGYSCKARSPKSLANIIKRIYHNKEKILFYKNCRYRYKNKFSEKIFIKKISELL